MNKHTPHIALVEDTLSLRNMYETALEQEGYKVSCFLRGADALDFMDSDSPDLLVIDLKLPDMDGLDILRRLRQRKMRVPVIVITGHGSINVAVDAIREGASDFLVKPFNIERLRDAVRNELEKDPASTMPAELAGLGDETPANTDKPTADPAYLDERSFGGFIGTSPIMQRVYEQIEGAAKSNASVFITGESGTGKEVCAEAIHKHSKRSDGPFVPINCAAIPRDLMESELFGHVKGAFTGAIAERDGAVKLAEGGTLFLDEAAEMTPDIQTKLLRFLQDFSFRKVGSSRLEKTDVRIVCATNKNPLDEIQAGNFREDLYYRLHVLPIYMPPLRDRGDDILDIAYALLKRYAAEENKPFEDFSEEAEIVLRSYSWPGNIRQLQNTICHVVVMHSARLVTAQMLPAALMHEGGNDNAQTIRSHSAPPFASRHTIRSLAAVERDAIEAAIMLCDGNIPQAAAALGVSPSTIYRKKTAWESEL